jgi:hypothetical protein
VANGAKFEFLFFPDAGSRTSPLGPGCLSQWCPCEFGIEGVQFRSAEQAMMHGKAILFGDLEAAARIAACRTAFQAQLLGREVRGFDELTWVAHREGIVFRANLAKFSQDPELRVYLLSTAGNVLAESSTTDLVWGAGISPDHPAASDPRRWPGLNLLGFVLMRVREELLPPANPLPAPPDR